jgi:hypothetical protein
VSLPLLERLTPVCLAEAVPGLTVGGKLGAAESAGRGGEASAAELLAGRGWFELALATPARCRVLADALDELGRAGLPLVAVYVFDEVWELGLVLRDSVSRALGATYELVADLWAFSIAPGRAGWPAHRGTYARLDRALPEYVNAWVAISDAGPERSCMHLVPLDEDDAYVGGSLEAVTVPPGKGLAAPLEAGGALAWNANVLHWGGPCAPEARGPRKSVTFTLCREDAALRRDLGAVTIVDPTRIDPWRRLEMIAEQILVYGDADSCVTEEARAWARLTSEMAARLRARCDRF